MLAMRRAWQAGYAAVQEGSMDDRPSLGTARSDCLQDRRGFLASASALTVSSLLSGCGGSSPTDGGPPDSDSSEKTIVRVAEIRPEVNVLPADGSVTVGQVTADTVIFTNDLPTVAPGEVLVSGQGTGLLRRVVETRTEERQLIVRTADAALTDVFAELDVDLRHTARAGDWASLQTDDETVQASRLRSRQSESSFSATFANTGLSVGTGGGTRLTAKLDGSVECGFGLEASLQLADSEVQSFRFVPRLSARSDVTLSAEVKVEGTTTPRDYLVAVGQPVVFAIGAVPLVVFPTLFLQAYLSGALAGGVKLLSQFDATAQAGVQWAHGPGFSGVSDLTQSGSLLPETAVYTTAQLEFVLCRARLTTAVYGLGGPSLNLKLLDFQTKLTTQPAQPSIKFEVDLLLGATVGAAFTWLSSSLPEVNLEVASGTLPLFEKTFQPGDANLTINRGRRP